MNRFGISIPSAPPLSAANGSKSSTSFGSISASGKYGGLAVTKSTFLATTKSFTSAEITSTCGAIKSLFFLSQSNAASLFSTAITFTSGISYATAKAIAPEPDPKSIKVVGRSAALIFSITPLTNSSVSGRGIKTPSPTRKVRYRKYATPVIY